MREDLNRSVRLEQCPLECEKDCRWHRRHVQGKVYPADELVPGGACPWLYHSVYPYFLGLFFGARFPYNEHGDCNVCCPAREGVDVIVRKRDNDGTFEPRVGPDQTYVIHAEVVGVNGDCPYGHAVGDRLVFPTCMMDQFACPAAFNNAFPLMRLEPPSCIDEDHVRCPDFADVIHFRINRTPE